MLHILNKKKNPIWPKKYLLTKHWLFTQGLLTQGKSVVNETNRMKRLEFAKAHVSKPLNFWKNIIFSIENKFNIFGLDGKKIVWRKPNTSLQTGNLKTIFNCKTSWWLCYDLGLHIFWQSWWNSLHWKLYEDQTMHWYIAKKFA